MRHNSESVKICIETEIRENFLYLTVIDNGKGYPPEILAALNLQETTENTPHILGLHVVEQIAAAHGGKVFLIKLSQRSQDVCLAATGMMSRILEVRHRCLVEDYSE